MATAYSKSIPGPEAGARVRPLGRPPRLFPGELFLVTAETRPGLLASVKELREHLERPDPGALPDLAYTVSRSYAPGKECLSLVVRSHDDLRSKLSHAQEKLLAETCTRIHDRDGIYYYREKLGSEKVAFLFPGENAQYVNMLAELCLHFPEIRSAFDEADAACLMAGDGFLPSALNFPPPGRNGADAAGEDEISHWEKAVVLVHTANVGLARLLRALKMRPDAVLGHSFGELSALEMAGVLRPGQGLDRIRFAHHAYLHLRELSRERDLPTGRLLAVGGAERAQIDSILARFPDSLRVAMENCPHQYVLCSSGPRADDTIAQAQKWLASEGAICSPLPIRRPYHTPFFEPAFPLEKAYFEEVGVHPPEIEVYSCSTTEPFPSEPEAIVEVAARHWMSCVRFQETITKMYDRGFRVFVDVGPRGNLGAFVGDILRERSHLAVALNRPQRSETWQLLNALGVLAAHGVRLSIEPLHERWRSGVVEIREVEGGKKERKPLHVQLPIHIPSMKADEIVLSRSATSATSAAPQRRGPGVPPTTPREPEPAAVPARASAPPGAELPPEAPPTPVNTPLSSTSDPVADVMISYLDTMDRFVKAQTEIVGSILRSGGAERPADAQPNGSPAPSRFPLLGTILEHVPEQSLTARRAFDVREDLYLDDHALGTAPSTTDPSLRALPVMPLLFSIEVAAEAAANMFPDLNVIATLNTRAHRWIFLERGSVTLRVVAKRVGGNGNDVHVRVSIHQETAGDPASLPVMVETTVVLSDAYPAPPPSRAESLPASSACRWDGTEIYPRRTFHGALFQGIREVDRRSDEGLDGRIEVLPTSGLLRSLPGAELETFPLIADSLGQAVWLWGSREPFNGVAYLPYHVGSMSFYGPPLLPGTPLHLKLRVRRREPLTVVTDIEGVDAEGNVRVLLKDLADREFPITTALHRLIMEPIDHSFADVRELDVALPSAPPCRISFGRIAGFPGDLLEGSFGVWRKALAFLILSPPEREEWMSLEAPLRREIQWLLGRAAAKDAARHCVQLSSGRRFAAADVILRNEGTGRPYVAGAWQAEMTETPEISISHTEGMVVAVAATASAGVRVGVDTEPIRAPGQDLADAAFSDAELALLPVGASAPERSEWVFRFWCAKEAVGKALGSGVTLEPRKLAITRADAPSGVVGLRPHGNGEVFAATFRQDTHVFAVAVLPTTP